MKLSPLHSQILLLGNSSLPKEQDKSIPNVQTNLHTFKTTLNEINFPPTYIETIANISDNISLLERIKTLSDNSKDLFILYYAGLILVNQNMYLTTQSSSYTNIQINGIALQTLTNLLCQAKSKHFLFLFDVQYDYADNQQSKLVIEELKNCCQNLSKAYFIISNPACNQPTPSIVQTLKSNLQNLENIHKANLSIKDICNTLKLEQNQHCYFYPSIPDVEILTNKRYIEAQKNLKIAHKLLEKGKWQDAMTYYNYSADFNFGDIIASKVQIIQALKKAESLCNKDLYKEAKEIYETLYQTSKLAFIKNNIITCHEKIADDYLKRGILDLANEHYKKMFHFDKKNSKIKNKIKDLNKQIEFFNLAQQADQAFYAQNYEAALDYYTQIENLNHNPVLKHRKDMASSFLEYKQTLKAELEREINSRVQNDNQKKQEILFEEKLWKVVSKYHEPIIYNLFITLFPNGTYTEQAKKQLQNLEQPSEQAKPQETKTRILKTQVENRSKTETTPIKPQTSIISDLPEPKDLLIQDNSEETVTTENPLAFTFGSQDSLDQLPKNKTNSNLDLDMLKPLTENQLWQEAQNQNTLKSYLNYINKTQEGIYLAQAYQKVQDLSEENS